MRSQIPAGLAELFDIAGDIEACCSSQSVGLCILAAVQGLPPPPVYRWVVPEEDAVREAHRVSFDMARRG